MHAQTRRSIDFYNATALLLKRFVNRFTQDIDTRNI